MKKNRVSLLLVVSFLVLFLTQCKEEQPVKSGNPTKPLYEREVALKDNMGLQDVSVRFRSSSKKLLENIPLDNFEFKIIKSSSDPQSINNLLPSGSYKGENDGNFKKVDDGDIISNEITSETENILHIDVLGVKQDEEFTVAFKSKNLSNAKTSSLIPPGVKVFFYAQEGYHRVHITNNISAPLDVAFYYNNCLPTDKICSSNASTGTYVYAGYSYTLYKDGWAYYYNCGKGRNVGARIVIPKDTPYNFNWKLTAKCKPD